MALAIMWFQDSFGGYGWWIVLGWAIGVVLASGDRASVTWGVGAAVSGIVVAGAFDDLCGDGGDWAALSIAIGGVGVCYWGTDRGACV
jgi:hypothetical protein